LHSNLDSSNLIFPFLHEAQQSRRELPEFGSHRGVIGQNDEPSRPERADPGRAVKGGRKSFEQHLLQLCQALGLG
jgi:hypothetical protein